MLNNNVGVFYYQQKDLEKAQKYFMQALKMQPAFAEAHRNLAVLYQDLGNNNEAQKYFTSYLELNPQTPEKTKIEDWLKSHKKAAP